jgi:hypothetical protein
MKFGSSVPVVLLLAFADADKWPARGHAGDTYDAAFFSSVLRALHVREGLDDVQQEAAHRVYEAAVAAGQHEPSAAALDELASLVAAKPASATVATLVAAVAGGREDHPEAVRLAESALLLDPHTPQLQLVLVEYLLKDGQFGLALVLLDGVLHAAGSSPQDREAAQKALEAVGPRLAQAACDAFVARDGARAAALLVTLLRRYPLQLLKLVNALVERCEMRIASGLLDAVEEPIRQSSGGFGPSLLHEAARVARFFGHDAKARRHAERALAAVGGTNNTEFRGFVLCLLRDYRAAFAEFRQRHEQVASQPNDLLTLFKLEHDVGQATHLHAKGKLAPSVPVGRVQQVYAQAIEQMQAACAAAAAAGHGTRTGSKRELPECDPFAGWDSLAPETRSSVQSLLSGPRQPPHYTEWSEHMPALNRECCDFGAVEASYLRGDIVVMDGFLTAPALAELLRLGLEAPNWLRVKAGGYIGAFGSDGFAPPVVARLASELEAAMPRVFGPHSLLMFWGFKHDTTLTRPYYGIKPHADTAAVNLNFWVTPDEANTNPEGGGLVLYDRMTPRMDKHEDFNNYAVGTAELGLTEANVRERVPYRQNRAALFTSAMYLPRTFPVPSPNLPRTFPEPRRTLHLGHVPRDGHGLLMISASFTYDGGHISYRYHATDTVEFAPGYETCRINYTLLFGFMESVRCDAAGDGTPAAEVQPRPQPRRAPHEPEGRSGGAAAGRVPRTSVAVGAAGSTEPFTVSYAEIAAEEAAERSEPSVRVVW